MSAISVLNPKAEVARAAQALAVNMSGAKVRCHLYFAFCLPISDGDYIKKYFCPDH
jgi:hypothetical protein